MSCNTEMLSLMNFARVEYRLQSPSMENAIHHMSPLCTCHNQKQEHPHMYDVVHKKVLSFHLRAGLLFKPNNLHSRIRSSTHGCMEPQRETHTHVVSAYLLSHYTMQLLANSLRKNAWCSVRAKVVTL